MSSIRTRVGALFLVSIASACQTFPRPAASALPFHVALAPINSVRKLETQAQGQMRFELGHEGLSTLNASLARALEAESFTQVTVLPVARRDGEEWDTIDDARERTKADLLLTADLQYGTGIYHSISPARAHATPFWLLPGPHYWAAQDHLYGVQATLTFKLFDLARCKEGEEDRPVELRRWFFSHAVSMHDLEYDFVDRVGLHIYYYFIGLVVPSTFLRRSGEDIEENLQQAFIRQLAQRVAEEIQLNRESLIRNEHDYSFHLVTKDLDVTRTSQDHAVVEFSLDLRRGRSRNQPVAFALFTDGEEQRTAMERFTQADLLQAVQPETPGSGHVRYRFRRELEVQPDSTNLRLHVAAGNAIATIREFTLSLPAYVPK